MPLLPSSLAAILSLLGAAFTAPTAQTFEALFAGFVGRVGEHTVCGMWQAVRLAGRLHHSRAHDFFARARWSADELGLLLLDFLVARFVDLESPIRLAVDGTVFGRSGRKVHGAAWHYDPAVVPGGRGFRFGNCFVVVGLVVRIPALGERAWCLPVLARLWLATPKPTKAKPEPCRGPSQQDLAALLVAKVAKRHPDRRIDLVGDAAFACKAMACLPEAVTLTAPPRANAAIHAPAPRPTGNRGRPRVKGERLGSPAELATAPAGQWRRVNVPGRGEAMVLVVHGLWYSVFGSRAIQLILVREIGDKQSYRIALISTDATTPPAELVARYRDRWSIEVSFQNAKHVIGVGEARNRAPRAVQRTVPFGLICQTITVAWYALHGDPTADVRRRRLTAPWYPTKRDPSMLDMLASLRRELIKAEFQATAGRHRRQRQNTAPAIPRHRAAA
jgi:hypothetical protein